MNFLIADNHLSLAAADWPWPNFRPAEFACRGEPGRGKIKIAIPLMDRLQALRIAMGRPMVVTSGYRTPEYNATLAGSAKHSQHCAGTAADISMGNFLGDERLFYEQARLIGFTGFGFYPDYRNVFMHLDLGPPRWWGDPKPWGIDPKQ